MTVNFNEPMNATINEIAIGETFLADRTSSKAKGLYMKVDKNSGMIVANVARNMEVAINLETGQLRKFKTDALVTKAYTEVSFVA